MCVIDRYRADVSTIPRILPIYRKAHYVTRASALQAMEEIKKNWPPDASAVERQQCLKSSGMDQRYPVVF
ncbi:hypothetical protein LAD67_09680 [Escherichia coli]|nr:hypothetical protein [Escherichia coli]